jgi:hypothetical protein
LETLVQIGGSLLILIPFTLAQMGRWRPDATAYLMLNLIGSSVLAIDALHGQQWGFLLLEGVWALVSASSLVRRSARGSLYRRCTRPADSASADTPTDQPMT